MIKTNPGFDKAVGGYRLGSFYLTSLLAELGSCLKSERLCLEMYLLTTLHNVPLVGLPPGLHN